MSKKREMLVKAKGISACDTCGRIIDHPVSSNAEKIICSYCLQKEFGLTVTVRKDRVGPQLPQVIEKINTDKRILIEEVDMGNGSQLRIWHDPTKKQVFRKFSKRREN